MSGVIGHSMYALLGLRAAPPFSTLAQSDRVASRSEAMGYGEPWRAAAQFMSAISSPSPRKAK